MGSSVSNGGNADADIGDIVLGRGADATAPVDASRDVPSKVDSSTPPIDQANGGKPTGPAGGTGLSLSTFHTLIFSDDFEGSKLDASQWTAVRSTPGVNGEEQYYVPENVSVAGGSLQIRSEARAIDGFSYASGAVTTATKFRFRFGRVDVRAQLPGGGGLWPTFWLLGDGCATDYLQPNYTGCHGWAGVGFEEIDIIDQADFRTDVVSNKIFYGGKWPNATEAQPTCWDVSVPGVSNLSQGFHVYSFVWGYSETHWYVDGHETCAKTESVELGGPIPATPMFIILNTAMKTVASSTKLPQNNAIDFVHVYQ